MSTKSVNYPLGPDIGPDETLRDTQGRLIDDAYVDGAVEDAIAQVRTRGRPSLSAAGESPLLRVRLSRELDDAVRRAAELSGASRSEWVRRALDEAVHRARMFDAPAVLDARQVNDRTVVESAFPASPAHCPR